MKKKGKKPKTLGGRPCNIPKSLSQNFNTLGYEDITWFKVVRTLRAVPLSI